MWAGLGWDAEHKGGRWVLRVATAVGEDVRLSTTALEWPSGASLPSLLDRYDALATLGYEVVQGGPGAWTWTEGMTHDGQPLLVGHTEVRPVVSL